VRAVPARLEGYCGNQAAAPVISGGGGLGLDGGMTEYLLVPHERLLVPMRPRRPTVT